MGQPFEVIEVEYDPKRLTVSDASTARSAGRFERAFRATSTIDAVGDASAAETFRVRPSGRDEEEEVPLSISYYGWRKDDAHEKAASAAKQEPAGTGAA